MSHNIEIISGSILGVTNGDTRSLDYSSYHICKARKVILTPQVAFDNASESLKGTRPKAPSLPYTPSSTKAQSTTAMAKAPDCAFGFCG